MKIVIARRAQVSLREITRYIAADNPTRAISFAVELQRKARAITRMPKAFSFLPGYESLGIRRRVHGNYLILYRIFENHIEILDYIHSSRDISLAVPPYDP
jgi:plasmid stabilization system protein ParE